MTVEPGYVAHLKDLLTPLGRIVVKRMFGGAGIYCDGVFFAIIDTETLYFKTDEESRAAYESENMSPFTFMTKDGPSRLPNYYRVPERLLDEPDDMRDWAQRAIAVAKKDAAAKKKSKKRVSARAPEPMKETKPRARTPARRNNRTTKR